MTTMFTTLVVILALWFSSAAYATTLDWTALNPAWDDTDISGQQSFLDIGGSGVDISVSYTDNMFSNNSVPNIYGDASAFSPSPSPEILGALRFTNDRVTLLETSVTIVFSQDVLISDLGTVSLSIINGRQENIVVEAFDSLGSVVLASTYGTNTPGLVQLDSDGDGAYRSRGLGTQESGQYGDTFYSYTDVAVRELRFTIFSTRPGEDDIVLAYSSQGIRNVSFSVVPEPSTAIFMGLGLFTLATRSIRRRSPSAA